MERLKNPYTVGGAWVAGIKLKQTRTVGFVYGDIPFPYSQSLFYPYANYTCNQYPKPTCSYGEYSTLCY